MRWWQTKDLLQLEQAEFGRYIKFRRMNSEEKRQEAALINDEAQQAMRDYNYARYNELLAESEALDEWAFSGRMGFRR